jgi:membrane glycosyltransferase
LNTEPTAGDLARHRLTRYLAALPIDDNQRRHLLELATREDGNSYTRLHEAIAGTTDTGTHPHSLRSVASRLSLKHADAPLQYDRHGRPRLVMTPPLARSRMRPQPLDRQPLRRLGRWVKARLVGRRHLMVPADDPVVTAQRHPWQGQALLRRLVLLALILSQTALASWFMAAVLPYHGTHWLEMILLAVYVILFAWVSAGFWTAVSGFLVLVTGWDRHAISRSRVTPLDAQTRTAILMPICNEDVTRVFAGLRATYTSLARTGELAKFDFYVLSDSSEPDTRVAEIEAWLKLCEDVKGFGRIFYRRRQLRIKRKSGNIADWCRRWGSAYRYMVILDADSVMSGSCLVRLAQLMEANPNAGIIQTAPQAAGRETLYARIQQYANRVYGPLFTAGLHFWQLGESHYWGHNAILRVAPFMEHCALGRLPGRGALAGEIMSHDFVEAALMRRAGWGVWMAYDLQGSYEEMPPALLDELRRDQRWCQGNLQNFRLFMAQGLHPAHRAVFMTGVMAYLSAPLWFLFLVLSTALLAVHSLVEPTYFTEPYQLFPIWPQWRPEWAVSLFGATAGLLFLPKILAVLRLLLRPSLSRLYGGTGRLLDSLIVESLFSALLAPIRMLFHTRYVVMALLGRAVKWQSPPRDDTETPWSEAIRRHGGDTALGIVWAAGVYWLNPGFLWWLLPIVGSLIISIPLSVWSSRVSLGRRFRQHRIFLIPEESQPPRELRWTRSALRRQPVLADGYRRAAVHPITQAVVSAAGRPRLLPAALGTARQRLIEQALTEGPEALSQAQRNLLLSDPDLLGGLHDRLWQVPNAAPAWGMD